MTKAVAAALVLMLPPSVQPWPIGPGPRYQPPARPHAVVASKTVGGLRCSAPRTSFRVHVELFANRRVVILPAGIGVSPRGCVYPLRTTAPDGVVRVERGATLRLGDLFAVWGQPLGQRRLASFTSSAPVRAYVGGRLVAGAAASVPLTPHAQIVVELGGYVPPHSSFLFAGGDS
jgi:hypothetical protein